MQHSRLIGRLINKFFQSGSLDIVNFICIGMVGDYSSKCILRTAVLDEAERCGGEFDGTIGVVLKDAVDVGAEMEKREAWYTPAWLSTEMKTLDESTSSTQKMLVVRVGRSTRRLRLVENDEVHGTWVFGVSSLTNQAERFEFDERNDVTLGFLAFIVPPLVLILPYVFIYSLTKFRKEGSTLTQRAWMMAWLCANQVSFFVFALFSLGSPSAHIASDVGAVFLVMALLPAIPAIGGFVMVGKMYAEFGTCSLSPS